ncbi:hypothetical protein HKX48_001834 [Thoreauomyces humboldtii]|nr:hypothetical protein HKX48_001834 [Thoreauomyces humboldtii]
MGLGGSGGTVNRGSKYKVKRGGGRHHTPGRVLSEQGDVWNHPRETDKPSSGSEDDSSSEEESSEEEEVTAANRPRPAGASNAKLGNTVESSDEDVKVTKKKAPAGAVDPAIPGAGNANRTAKTHLKASDIGGGDRELSRREREALAKERATAAFWKAQEEGKTDQARADLARLAIIKKNREEAAKRKAEEAANKGKPVGAKAESLNAGRGIISKSLGKK